MNEASEFILSLGGALALLVGVTGWVCTREWPEERMMRELAPLIEKLEKEHGGCPCRDCPCAKCGRIGRRE